MSGITTVETQPIQTSVFLPFNSGQSPIALHRLRFKLSIDHHHFFQPGLISPENSTVIYSTFPNFYTTPDEEKSDRVALHGFLPLPNGNSGTPPTLLFEDEEASEESKFFSLELEDSDWGCLLAFCSLTVSSCVRDLRDLLSTSDLIIVLNSEAKSEVSSLNTCSTGLWGLVNNAGIATYGMVEWQTIDIFQNVLDVNLLGSIRTTLAFAPLIRKSKGRMVFLSSTTAYISKLSSIYSMSKAGLEKFCDCLRLEMKQFGVQGTSALILALVGGPNDITPANSELSSVLWITCFIH
ncbi:unnamed protein product [Ranitomeya imitator]|uniref:Uncharacterized protein n=1 Tax=Ranitomeya imitator TaxID=111125 RepID=A0ABN9M8Q4_9NEOB|nr:unnamed protein product [Ranitomeya imitator]